MTLPEIATPEQWAAAYAELRAEEKELTPRRLTAVLVARLRPTTWWAQPSIWPIAT